MEFIKFQLDEALYINHKQFIYVILYINDMRIIRPSDNYFNEMNGLFKNKYIIFDATYFNQYLNVKLINNNKNDVLLI